MITAREFWIDFKGIFRGWRLVIPILFTLLVVIMSLTNGEDELSQFVILYFLWTTLSMRPKLNKLNYLLPGDEKDRFHRILLRCLAVFLYNMLWYGIFLSIMVLFSEYHYVDELVDLFCEVLPLLITYTSFSINSAYNPLNFQDPWFHRHKKMYIISLVLSYTTIFIALGLTDLLNGLWYVIYTAVAYIGASSVLYWQIKIIQNTDLSFENIRKVEKIF